MMTAFAQFSSQGFAPTISRLLIAFLVEVTLTAKSSGLKLAKDRTSTFSFLGFNSVVHFGVMHFMRSLAEFLSHKIRSTTTE
jgi:hypothetical protein